MITIGIPVLGRPERAPLVHASIVESSTVPFEVIWLVSPGDDDQLVACRALGGRTLIVPWKPGPGDFSRKHSFGCSRARYPWYFAGADDLEFLPGWDTAALRAGEDGAKVIGTNDLANPAVMRGDHATHSLVETSYVQLVGCTWLDGPGHLYSPDYDHQYCDSELVMVAKERGVWAFAEGSHVKHHHPIFDKSVPMDDTYRRALAKGREDREVFLSRQRLARRALTR